MNGKDHCSSREPLVVSASIFYYRQSVRKIKKRKELNNKSKDTNTNIHEQFSDIFIFFLVFIIFLLHSFQKIIRIYLCNQCMPMLTLKCPRYQIRYTGFIACNFIMERTTLCLVILCSTYDTQMFGSLNLIGVPAVFYRKMAFSKQHALRSGHACFRAMIALIVSGHFSMFFTCFSFLKQLYAVSACFLYLLPSCAHIRRYYHVEFIHVAETLHRA